MTITGDGIALDRLAGSSFAQKGLLFSDVKKHPDEQTSGNGYGHVGDDQARDCAASA
jgi:hypothetical protein